MILREKHIHRTPFFLNIFILLIFLGGPIFSTDFWSIDEDDIPAFVETMKPEEVVSQVFLVAYSGIYPPAELLEWIRLRNIGGIKVFGWNTDNLSILRSSISRFQTEALNAPGSVPLVVATDQEGGWVRHVRGPSSFTPGNLAIGASGIPSDAYNSGYYIGEELSQLGINLNFAPTVDVYKNPEAHVIGPRAFSSDPVETSVLATAYVTGMQDAGIICTAKHFPGHGNAVGDSHGMLPVVQDDLDTIWDRDLLPYRFLIRENLPAILTGHLSFPAISGNNLPASLSRELTTDLLRRKLGFDGLVITDDLYMHGASNLNKPFEDICLMALEAGNDMIMLSQTPALNDHIWNRILAEYKSNEGFRDQLKQSVVRILEVKKRFISKDQLEALKTAENNPVDSIPSSAGRNFFFQQACRSITILDDKKIPFVPKDHEKVLILAQTPDFVQAAKKSFPNAESHIFPYLPFYNAETGVVNRVLEISKNYDVILFSLLNPNSQQVLNSLRHLGPKIIVISGLTPIYLQKMDWVETAIAVYGYTADSFDAGLAVLTGDFEAEGVLPVEF